MRKIILPLIITALLFSATAFSQNMYLKIPGIEGESTRKGHEKEILVRSYSQSINSCPPANHGGGAGACKVSISPLSMEIVFDKSNIALKTAVLTGKIFSTADFVLEKEIGDANSFPYYRIHMEGVSVISSQESGSEGDSPALAISLTFTKIAWQYSQQGKDGEGSGPQSSTGWDLSSNKIWTYVFPN